ncbi:MAG: hypothetical protein M1819_005507 [Sarea resinae]|nr:MAG: hypothetical protein M1819_005507 [Sarea resinae]
MERSNTERSNMERPNTVKSNTLRLRGSLRKALSAIAFKPLAEEDVITGSAPKDAQVKSPSEQQIYPIAESPSLPPLPPSPIPSDTPRSSRDFLAFPETFRKMVYRQLLLLDYPIFLCFFKSANQSGRANSTSTFRGWNLHPAILRTNRQIHDEALEVLFYENLFTIPIRAGTKMVFRDSGFWHHFRPRRMEDARLMYEHVYARIGRVRLLIHYDADWIHESDAVIRRKAEAIGKMVREACKPFVRKMIPVARARARHTKPPLEDRCFLDAQFWTLSILLQEHLVQKSCDTTRDLVEEAATIHPNEAQMAALEPMLLPLMDYIKTPSKILIFGSVTDDFINRVRVGCGTDEVHPFLPGYDVDLSN